MPTTIIPFIPKYITVHLGAPSSNAQDVTLPFPDYIKNVASSEIYPTWDESAITANVYAQISFAVNRVYNEFYVSQGYPFNITNSTAIDQKFIYGRNIFENISNIVDEIFDSYIRRIGFAEPLATKYCNGTTVMCDGLSQWGSQSLAEQGRTSVEILRYYYGNNIEIVSDAPINEIRNSYNGPLSIGSSNPRDVATVQVILNRVSEDYPLIPKLTVDGVFGESTRDAVIVFQDIFNLSPDGIVGKSTWYKLIYLYTGMTGLSELNSEGQKYFNSPFEYPNSIELGDSGENVSVSQYLLQVVSWFYPQIPTIEITGVFDEATQNATKQLQKQYNLPETGILDATTWDYLYRIFVGIRTSLDSAISPIEKEAEYLSTLNLSYGDTGNEVQNLQKRLNSITTNQGEKILENGVFTRQTRMRIMDFQKNNNLTQTGILDAPTLTALNRVYRSVFSNNSVTPNQYPKNELKQGDMD
ncbi:MAG: spore cortex-lytic protein [Ruminococcaceae bacterium]|nr:spore cortex-lytic protein [Oscillospiraceae bacterium]